MTVEQFGFERGWQWEDCLNPLHGAGQGMFLVICCRPGSPQSALMDLGGIPWPNFHKNPALLTKTQLLAISWRFAPLYLKAKSDPLATTG